MVYQYNQEELEIIQHDKKAKKLKNDLEKEGIRFSLKRFRVFMDFKSKKKYDNNSKSFFLAKYGEEKYEELYLRQIEQISNRAQNQLNTKQKYINHYGLEKGTQLWNKRIENQKFSQSKEGYIQKYGHEEGEKLWYKINKSKGKTKEEIIKKKGEKAYDELMKKRTHTLENYLELYGEKEGNKKWKKHVENSIMYGDGKKPNQILYWTKQGYSEEEAKEKVRERQITFSLEICIKKHGVEEGTRIWKERQEKWQNTLKNLPNYDKICKSRGVNSNGDPHFGYLNEKTISKYFDNTPGTLYFIKFTKDNEIFWKVGITHKSVKERFNHEMKNFDLDIIHEIKFTLLIEAFRLEQHVLSTFGEHRISIRDEFFRSTECFNKNVLEGMTNEDIRNFL